MSKEAQAGQVDKHTAKRMPVLAHSRLSAPERSLISHSHDRVATFKHTCQHHSMVRNLRTETCSFLDLTDWKLRMADLEEGHKHQLPMARMEQCPMHSFSTEIFLESKNNNQFLQECNIHAP